MMDGIMTHWSVTIKLIKIYKYDLQALKVAGAGCIYVLATHGVLSAEALAIISSLDPKFVKSVHVTNSIPQNISKVILKERLGIIDISGMYINR